MTQHDRPIPDAKASVISLRIWALTGLALCLSPLFALSVAGVELKPFLEFPPRTLFLAHAPFSSAWWAVYALAGTTLLWLITRHLTIDLRVPHFPGIRSLALLLLLLASWTIAWHRLECFQNLQQHTFLLLWVFYILLMNALLYEVHGSCPLTSDRIRYLLSFPISGVFWWGFEVLNRFTQNWYYIHVEHLSPFAYLLTATLSFSTVLPSIWVTQEFISRTLISTTMPTFKFSLHSRALPAFIIAGLALSMALPFYPDYLFALIWVLPLMLAVTFQHLLKRKPIAIHGAALAAITGLWCGFLWELWNHHSLAKWIYLVPFVQQYQLFEMPIVGYAGYLPFGILCAMVIESLRVTHEGSNGT